LGKVQDSIEKQSHGFKASFVHVKKSDLVGVQLPLPPTQAEQQAIAEALSDADALIESLEHLIAKKRHLKQGAMQELLTGKKRLPGFSDHWEVKAFGEIAQPRKERVDPRRTGAHEFCVELEHIEQGTGCLVGHTATAEDSSLKSVFQEEDVLFGKLRAYLRKYWLANRKGVCSTEIWVLVAERPLLIPQFLFQVVKMNRFVETASSAHGTHMPRSDWSVVKSYELKLPPVKEQAAIAAILTDMDLEIAALEAKLSKARQLKQGMMQELLTGRIRLA
jgi:type I restriction enzyme S subunit